MEIFIILVFWLVIIVSLLLMFTLPFIGLAQLVEALILLVNHKKYDPGLKSWLKNYFGMAFSNLALIAFWILMHETIENETLLTYISPLIFIIFPISIAIYFNRIYNTFRKIKPNQKVLIVHTINTLP